MSRIIGRHGRRKSNVPNLSGLTRSQAQAALTSRGLNFSESVTNTSDSGLNGLVQSQGTASNTVVLIGSTISFVYYNYVAPQQFFSPPQFFAPEPEYFAPQFFAPQFFAPQFFAPDPEPEYFAPQFFAPQFFAPQFFAPDPCSDCGALGCTQQCCAACGGIVSGGQCIAC